MKYYGLISVLILCSINAMAEDKSNDHKAQIYTKSSNSAVNQLNKTTEILRNPSQILKKIVANDDSLKNKEPENLRDPTKMSGNFRQALKGIRPNSNTNSDNTNTGLPEMPDITLAAKILGKKKTASVILKVNKRSFHIFEGKSASFVDNHQVINIRVDEIKKTYVRIFVWPHNEQLILQ